MVDRMEAIPERAQPEQRRSPGRPNHRNAERYPEGEDERSDIPHIVGVLDAVMADLLEERVGRDQGQKTRHYVIRGDQDKDCLQCPLANHR